jgi:putative PIN family toxin of toxin-antitoxin system
MRNVVIDTNVLVSAALTPQGNARKIMNMVIDGDFQLYFSDGIIAEYLRVLRKPKLSISPEVQYAILESVKEVGKYVFPTLSTIHFNDEDDRVFYDTAKSCDAILITGNLKHYPVENDIMSPTSFLAAYNQ